MGRLHDVESHDEEQESQCQSWISLFIWCTVSYICMLVVFIWICFPEFSLLKLGLLPVLVHGSSPALFYAFSPHVAGHFEKPKNLVVIALVPFHQRQQTEILNCYLQRNLVDNRGFLDKVVFIPQTNDAESLEWLSSMVEQNPAYEVSQAHGFPLEIPHGKPKDRLFTWIDGDVVYLEDHTIPTLIKTKLDHPDSLVVSANVVNQAVLQPLHSHPSVALPYRPEMSPKPAGQRDNDSWRASLLPPWDGPAEFKVHKGFPPPFANHRWLPGSDEDFDRTPIGMSVYSDDGPGFDDWTVSAQQHYSFLHHLELGDLYRYKFPLWKNPAEPISHSFLCFRGTDAADVLTLMQESSWSHNNKNSRHIIIDGKGLAAHYSAEGGLRGLEHTDVLMRYRAYAKEMVCPVTA